MLKAALYDNMFIHIISGGTPLYIITGEPFRRYGLPSPPPSLGCYTYFPSHEASVPYHIPSSIYWEHTHNWFLWEIYGMIVVVVKCVYFGVQQSPLPMYNYYFEH